MFDLIAKPDVRPLQERSFGSRVTAIAVHVGALTALLAIPAYHAVVTRPEVPTILTFVATPLTLSTPALPAPPPSSPVTPASPASARRQVATPNPVDTVAEPPAPAEASSDVKPEPESTRGVDRIAGNEGAGGGIVEGGAGGINGGLVGGVPSLAPPPPPPKPTASSAPVRVGGPIKTPNLITRVEPVYSAVAASTQLAGLVLLEAVVDVNGSVSSVRLLHSGGAPLDSAAIDALKQWKYSPLVLNGVPTPFVVTVTFNFRLG